MVALASAFVRLRPEPDKREFRRAGEEMGREAGAAAGEEFAKGYTRGADGKLRDSRGKFIKDSEVMGERAGAGAGKGFSAGLGKSIKGGSDETGAFGKVLAITAARLTLFGAAAGAATPGVLHLTAAVLPAAGALLALPVAMAAVKVASASLTVATSGVSDAIKDGLTGTAKQAEKSLKELPPAARTFAKSIIALKPELEDIRATAAQGLFAPIQDEIGPLADIYLPRAERGMGKVATSLGGVAQQISRTAKTSKVFVIVDQLFAQTAKAVDNLKYAVDPLADIFNAVIGQTVGQLPRLSLGIADAAERFANFVDKARDAGQIKSAFEAGITTLKDLGGIVFNVGSIFASVFRAAGQGSGSLLSNLRELTGQAAAFLRTGQGFGALSAVFATLGQFGAALRSALGSVLPAIASSVQILGPAVAALAAPFAELVRAVAPLLPLLSGIAATVLRALTPAIVAISGYLAENETAVKALVIVYTGWISALKISAGLLAVQAAGGVIAYIKTIKIVTTMTKIWTATQYALNTALLANPIGLAIAALVALAGVIYLAWTRSETFRKIVLAVWAAIKVAIAATVNWIVNTAWPAIKSAWDGIASAAMWLWRNVIMPVWNGIKLAIQVAIEVIKRIIGDMIALFRAVAAPVVWLYKTIFGPIFAAIRKVIEIFWVSAQIIFKLFVLYIKNVIVPAVQFFWRIAVAVFNAIIKSVQAWWRAVQAIFALFRTYVIGPLKVAFNFLLNTARTVFAAVAGFIRTWYNATIVPIFALVRAAWSAVAGAFKRTYETAIRPVFNAFSGFIKNVVVKGFQTGVEAIRVAWNKVQEYAKKPVSFVVNKVINPFIGGINKAASVVGVKDRIEPIKGFAGGGQIPGVRAPGDRDTKFARVRQTGKLFAVGAKEYVTNARSTVANLPLVQAINAKRGKVTRDDIDPYLDGNDGPGRGDGFGDLWGKITGGLKGAANVVLNPIDSLKKMANSLLNKIPGGGMVREVVKGSAKRMIDGALKWIGNLGLGGIGGGSVAGGWKGMQRLISQRFPGLGMISGPRPGARTLNGSQSYHALGRAVDYPPLRALAVWIKSTFGAKTKELISPWNDLNLHNGRPHAYSGDVFDQHAGTGRFQGNAHVHWAARLGGMISRLTGMPMSVFDSGGAWPSGTIGVNTSGRTEYVDPNRGGDRGGITVVIQAGAFNGAIIANSKQAEDLVVRGVTSAVRNNRITAATLRLKGARA